MTAVKYADCRDLSRRILTLAAATAPIALPPCPDCAGGGDVNGVPCRRCRGKGREAAPVRAADRLRRVLHGWSLGAAGAAGTLVRWSATIPGIAGAAGVTYGLSVFVHAAWGWIPVSAPAAFTGGVFLLALDRRL